MIEPIDPDRWDEVWADDLVVLRRLASQGDQVDVPRLVDVSFRGPADALARLAASAANFGFAVQDRDTSEDKEPWLFLERMQTTDIDSMREFTLTYLQIEDAFSVKSDGWGCMAQTNPGAFK